MPFGFGSKNHCIYGVMIMIMIINDNDNDNNSNNNNNNGTNSGWCIRHSNKQPRKHLKTIGVTTTVVELLQKAALFRTARILRKVLEA